MDTNHASLAINQLELHVHLGWHNDERSNLQKVLLDIGISFEQPPKACDTDQLEDSICYAKLIDKLHDYLKNKQYALIEHLSKDLHQWTAAYLPQASYVTIHLTKFPAIKGLTGGVSFTYV